MIWRPSRLTPAGADLLWAIIAGILRRYPCDCRGYVQSPFDPLRQYRRSNDYRRSDCAAQPPSGSWTPNEWKTPELLESPVDPLNDTFRCSQTPRREIHIKLQ